MSSVLDMFEDTPSGDVLLQTCSRSPCRHRGRELSLEMEISPMGKATVGFLQSEESVQLRTHRGD